MIAYKQFRMDKVGNLHPLFVCADETIPIGQWLKAREGPRTENGKVKSRLGPLAYRPGWHLSEAPYAPHIGIKENGKVKYMRPDTVWAMCEVMDKLDWNREAHDNGVWNGKYIAQKACLPHLPYDGFYWYKTNPNAFGRWLIAEKIKVLDVLNDMQVENICWNQFGVHAQPRKG